MFKLIALFLVVFALSVLTNRYTNEVIDKYNALSAPDRLYTQIWCTNENPKTMQDHLDCKILELF